MAIHIHLHDAVRHDPKTGQFAPGGGSRGRTTPELEARELASQSKSMHQNRMEQDPDYREKQAKLQRQEEIRKHKAHLEGLKVAGKHAEARAYVQKHNGFKHLIGDGSVEETMHEYKHGQLHSGSKRGPLVRSRRQAVAIALSQAGKSNKDADYDPPHDPKNGQFASGQHSQQAAHHRKRQEYHETEAKRHGETSTSGYGSHGNAAAHHHSAAFYHEKAAEAGDPEHVKKAHQNSKIATQASKKVASQGSSYNTPASKPREEKSALTAQQQSAKRIAKHLAANRIRLRSGR